MKKYNVNYSQLLIKRSFDGTGFASNSAITWREEGVMSHPDFATPKGAIQEICGKDEEGGGRGGEDS